VNVQDIDARSSHDAIGIFDSGVGGLAVYRAIRELLPTENLIYVADTRYAPYGERDARYVESRTTAIAEFLTIVGVKAIVVACNTATTVAVRKLREIYRLPVVGIEPGIKPAVERSAAKKIVVLATQRTIESEAVRDLLQRYGSDAEIILQSCPGLVEQVERGEMDAPETLALLRRYTQPVFDSAADVIVLGCTHYAFLEPRIRGIVGNQVVIIEPSRAVARQLDARLTGAALHGESKEPGRDEFFTSANDADAVARTMSMLLGSRISVSCMYDHA
jgi:glutamate racemase